jgi:Tfp pilus assembly protein PilP
MKSVLHKKSGVAGIFARVLAIGFLVVVLGIGMAEARKNTKKSGKTAEKMQLTPEKLALLDKHGPSVTYDSLGRQDPFRPFFDLTHIERAIPSDPSRPRTPLEKFALNQYHLVGIMLAGGDHNYALVEDPERVGHTVHVGDLIGNQSGRVTAINENEVIVEEPYLDIFDQRQTRTIALRLHALDEESTLPLLPDSQTVLPPATPEQDSSATAPVSSKQPEKNSVN